MVPLSAHATLVPTLGLTASIVKNLPDMTSTTCDTVPPYGVVTRIYRTSQRLPWRGVTTPNLRLKWFLEAACASVFCMRCGHRLLSLGLALLRLAAQWPWLRECCSAFRRLRRRARVLSSRLFQYSAKAAFGSNARFGVLPEV